MAANNYYQHSSQQEHYQPFNPSDPLGPTPYSSQNAYPHYGHTAPSIAPSYYTNDPLDHRQDNSSPAPPNNPSRLNPYSDHVPMQNQQRIQTNQSEWPSTQHTAYPPSPESQNPDPALLAASNKRRKKKKTGLARFFSGKIPWFVYFITLVQITVFIVEIVKNCKQELRRSKVTSTDSHSDHHWLTNYD